MSEARHEVIDPAALDRRSNYRLFTSLLVPRPIGWLTTLSDDGSINLAPFSFFGAVSANPPVVVVSIGERRGEAKDTARNLAARGQFVANLATWDLVEAVDATAADLPYGTSEVEAAGLSLAPSDVVGPPRVAESPVHLEAVVVETVSLPDVATGIYFGRVVRYHVRADLLAGDRVDPRALDPLARLGAGGYGRLGEIRPAP